MKNCITLAAILAAGAASAQVANTPDIASALPVLGWELSPEMVGGTMKLYGPLHAAETDDGLVVSKDQPYGPHERNRLDIYAPADASAAPVVVFLNGGGFVRGDKAGAANIGRWFARHGVVGVTMNYRFAPDAQWPSGAEDVAQALDWVRANIAASGGDPARIVLVGNSAGSVHVADYIFREEMQVENDGVTGAILISPPAADLRGRDLDPARDALYYADGDRAAQSIVTVVEGRCIPVMIAYAEHEPAGVAAQTRILVEALANRDGHLPVIATALGHNHISIVEHIGTADETLGPRMMDFIATLP